MWLFLYRNDVLGAVWRKFLLRSTPALDPSNAAFWARERSGIWLTIPKEKPLWSGPKPTKAEIECHNVMTKIWFKMSLKFELFESAGHKKCQNWHFPGAPKVSFFATICTRKKRKKTRPCTTNCTHFFWYKRWYTESAFSRKSTDVFCVSRLDFRRAVGAGRSNRRLAIPYVPSGLAVLSSAS